MISGSRMCEVRGAGSGGGSSCSSGGMVGNGTSAEAGVLSGEFLTFRRRPLLSSHSRSSSSLFSSFSNASLSASALLRPPVPGVIIARKRPGGFISIWGLLGGGGGGTTLDAGEDGTITKSSDALASVSLLGGKVGFVRGIFDVGRTTGVPSVVELRLVGTRSGFAIVRLPMVIGNSRSTVAMDPER